MLFIKNRGALDELHMKNGVNWCSSSIKMNGVHLYKREARRACDAGKVFCIAYTVVFKGEIFC